MAHLLRQKKGDLVGKTKRGKGTKIMALVDGNGLPLAIDIESASPSEVKLIERLIDKAATEYVPNKLIYDKAADGRRWGCGGACGGVRKGSACIIASERLTRGDKAKGVSRRSTEVLQLFEPVALLVL